MASSFRRSRTELRPSQSSTSWPKVNLANPECLPEGVSAWKAAEFVKLLEDDGLSKDCGDIRVLLVCHTVSPLNSANLGARLVHDPRTN